MAPSFRGTACTFFFVCLTLGAWAEDKTFPTLSQIEIEFYQTEVQLIDITQQATAYAKEYFDYSEGRGRVEVLAVGTRLSVFYNNETNEILEVNSTNCQTWEISESQYDYTPMFYGWLNKNPIIVGPSAALWFAQGKNPKYEGTEDVRAIKCDKFSLKVTGPRDNMMIYYYFAVSDWTTPYQMSKLITPVRIVAIGNSSQDAERAEDMVPVNQITDFAYFRPTISDWGVLQPPEGIGCPLRKATISMPTTPKIFRFNAEVVDLLQGKNEADQDVNFIRVWYDFERKLARLDKYTKIQYKSELYDFNTGVTYSNKNDETCLIKPLRNSMFESYSGKRLLGSLKEPAEVLGLDGDLGFYYMGKKTIRGFVVDVFENVKLDLVFKDQNLIKLVTTVYFTQEYLEANVDGITEQRIPVYMMLTGYNATNTVSIKDQYNIFGFSDTIWPDMYTSFQVDKCFPLDEDKSYFVLVIEVPTETAAKMEEQDDMIIMQLRSKIAEKSGISEMRLPFLKADYKDVGVFVTGLMLNRPPALQQFELENEGDTVTYDEDLKPGVEANTREKCALACVDEEDFTCTGFYFCNDACFMKSKDLLEDIDPKEKRTILGNCQTWLRAERESTNKEAYLQDALMLLEEAVLNSSLIINLYPSDIEKDEIPVQDIVIGEGPYTGQNNVDKPYTTVINYAKLNKDETTQEVPSVSTLNDCYQACKKSDSLNCASFSYCPDADNKQCLISSVLVVSRKKNPDDTTDDKNCFVYSMNYLDLFNPYPGRVLLISGEDTVTNIDTAEACAKNCREEKKFRCRGFEYCRSTKTCVLHSKHVLDLSPGQVSTDKSKNPKCTHYAAKFSSDYDDMGYTLVVDDSDKRTEITLEECAKACSEERKDTCKSFNYCPPTDEYSTDSTCTLSSKMLGQKGITTTTKKKCHHYEKKKNVDDWVASQNENPSGYTSSGFAGLVVGMLALGLIVGAVLFVVYSYYKSRGGGEGMSVRFMKQET